ncbi:hypothetical protein HK102_011234, partial [Quaeritorhiza haematococci]
MLNVKADVAPIVPLRAIQYWCLPATFLTLAVLAVFISFLLIRARIGLIYEVTKLNALLGLHTKRVERVNPLSIFYIMHLLVVVLGGGSAGLAAGMLAYGLSKGGPAPAFPPGSPERLNPGEGGPEVAVPLGDFFGAGPGLNPVRTLVQEVREDGAMVSRWEMPYKGKARIAVVNQSGHAADLVVRYNWRDDPTAADKLTFHARWRQRDDVPTVTGDGTLDWPALRVSGGTGRFVGLLGDVHNPTPAWWGEGDEKVYVDGEAFPSTFGTGTEDYFGYAWCDPHPYMNPFHAQTRCDGPGNKGNTSNLRVHVLDNIPFDRSLAFDLELWHWEAVKVQFATIAYAYAAPGAKVEPSGLPDLSTRIVHPRPPIKREPGAIEAESLRLRDKTAGEFAGQDMTPFGDAWSGSSQLFWIVREPGARLDLELPVEKAGPYALWAAFTKAADYGVVQLALDGAPLGKPLDLYAPNVAHSGEVPLGVVDLDA